MDVLAFGAHPDDVELACGGTMIQFGDAGLRLAVIDITRGERGTSGTVEERAREAEHAAEMMGLVARESWDFPDTELVPTIALRKAVVSAIRRYRPMLVLAPGVHDRHPDHAAAGQAVQDAYYPAGMKNFAAPGDPFRPATLLHYFLHRQGRATVVVDVTPVWQRRLDLARCFASQIQPPAAEDFQTLMARPDLLALLEGRARGWGQLVGFPFGEAFQAMTGAVGIPDVRHLLRKPSCASE